MSSSSDEEYETSITSESDYDTDSLYSSSDISVNVNMTFEEKYNKINEILNDIKHTNSIIDSCNLYVNGDWCKVNRFLHTSDDRLSTVGSGHIIDNPELNFIWKVCESWDYTIFAEMRIMKQLEEMFEWNPHFVRLYNLVELPINTRFSCDPRKFIPFQYKNKSGDDEHMKKMCKNHFMLMEELQGHLSVYDYFKIVNDNGGHKINNIIYSVLIQTLLSIYNANKYCDFTHYDLHTSNVLMEDTDDNYRLYITEDNNKFFVKTYGLSTVIIDTGYSYSSTLKNSTIDTCITNFPIGYTPICSNINHDFRTFLLNIVWDYPRESSETREIKNILKSYSEKYYKNNHINMKTGWLKLKKENIFVLKTYIEDITKLCSKKSIIYDYAINCFDVFSHLVSLPFENETTEKINIKYHREKFMNFYNLFIRIENKCGKSSNFRKYIFKSVIHIFHKYLNTDNYDTQFETDLISLLNNHDIKIQLFDYEKFYRSIKEYIPLYKNAIYNAFTDVQKQNMIDFANVPSPMNIMHNIESIYSPNFNITLDCDDIIFVYDAKLKSKHIIKVPETSIHEFNSMDHAQKTEFLYKQYISLVTE